MLFKFHRVNTPLGIVEDSSTVLYPIAAHVVDEEVKPTELPPSIFEATPVVESKPNEAQHLKALVFKSRKCRIISAISLMLIIGVIVVAVVVMTQNASNKATPSIETQPDSYY